jgi:amino acid adenylation domain-containing protein
MSTLSLPGQFMPGSTCADRFAHVADIEADTIAVRHNAIAMTYRELAGRAGGLARLLRTRGVRPGDVVATVLDRSPSAIVAMLGIWAAGAAYAHIDPAEPDRRILWALPETGARLVLTDRGNARRVPGAVLLDNQDSQKLAPYQPVAGRSASDLAYLVLTSGSTGEPKAVAVEHGSVDNYVTALRRRLGPLPDTFASTTTFAADLGNTSVFGALLHGGTLDIIDSETVLDPTAFAQRLREYPVGLLKCTPSQLEALFSAAAPADVLPTDVLLVGGEVFPPRLAATVLAARPKLAVFNHYGPAETTVGVLTHRVTDADLAGDTIPIGRPLAGVDIAVLSASGRPVAHGDVGQLHIGGRATARGYVGDDDLTAARFVQRGDGRYYASGDLVRRNDNGDIEFVGRTDRQLKISGNRIEPAEIENVLLAQRGIRQAVVTAEPAGQDRPAELVAYLVGLIDHSSLVRRLWQALPAGHVPGRIHQVARIPFTRNGKTNFPALRKLAADAMKPRDVGVERPRTPTERIIADVWCEVLKHVEIDVHAPFGKLGGDSLKSLAVFGKLHRHFPELTVAQLAAYSTVAELAAALGDDSADPSPTTVVQL